MDDAWGSFEGVLALNPTNLVANLGKVLYPRTQIGVVADVYLGQDSVCSSKLQGGSAIIPKCA